MNKKTWLEKEEYRFKKKLKAETKLFFQMYMIKLKSMIKFEIEKQSQNHYFGIDNYKVISKTPKGKKYQFKLLIQTSRKMGINDLIYITDKDNIDFSRLANEGVASKVTLPITAWVVTSVDGLNAEISSYIYIERINNLKTGVRIANFYIK